MPRSLLDTKLSKAKLSISYWRKGCCANSRQKSQPGWGGFGWGWPCRALATKCPLPNPGAWSLCSQCFLRLPHLGLALKLPPGSSLPREATCEHLLTHTPASAPPSSWSEGSPSLLSLVSPAQRGVCALERRVPEDIRVPGPKTAGLRMWGFGALGTAVPRGNRVGSSKVEGSPGSPGSQMPVAP